MKVDYIYEGTLSTATEVEYIEREGDTYLLSLEDGNGLLADEIEKVTSGGEKA